VIGKKYLTRQATTVLRLAKTTTDPKVAAALLDKAADLKSRVDETMSSSDTSLLAPDVERPR
jgi:hypothetical protein